MIKVILILSLFYSCSLFANVDIHTEFNINGELIKVKSWDVEFGSSKSIKHNGLIIEYKVSKSTSTEPDNQEAVVFDIILLRNKDVLGRGKIKTLYGEKASLGVSNQDGKFSINFTPRKRFLKNSQSK